MEEGCGTESDRGDRRVDSNDFEGRSQWPYSSNECAREMEESRGAEGDKET